MTQALFEVQTFDGHGWVTRHRGADVDSAGEAARRVLPDAKRHAVRIVKQVYDPLQQRLDNQIVFSLGKARSRSLGRAAGVAAALALSAAAVVGATLLPAWGPKAVAEVVAEVTAEAAAEVTEPGQRNDPAEAAGAEIPRVEAPQLRLATLTPAAGTLAFDCKREAASGLVRATNVAADRDRLYQLCGQAAQGDPVAQVELAAQLAAGSGTVADPAQAVLWLQEAARAGHEAAYRPLADLLSDADPARAISWYHRAATGGDSAAALTLAERYRDGVGVGRDARIALSYELMAAETGDVPAMLRVARAFASGAGADANPEAAQRWLERAAAAGDAQALAALDDPTAESTIEPTIRWAAPVDLELAASAPAPSQAAPAMSGGLLSVPPLQLDIDHDAQEVFSAFIGAALPVSV